MLTLGDDFMNKKLITFFIMLLIVTSTLAVQASNSNQDNKNPATQEKLYYALIMSLAPSIEEALSDTYKDVSKGIPQWAGWDTEILEIKQLQGVGGAYDVTVEVRPYYGALIGEGIDEIEIRVEASGQKIINNKHIQDIK